MAFFMPRRGTQNCMKTGGKSPVFSSVGGANEAAHINNGRKGEEQEAAKAEAARTSPEKRPSIRERLAEAKKECGERKPPDKAHQKEPPEHDL